MPDPSAAESTRADARPAPSSPAATVFRRSWSSAATTARPDSSGADPAARARRPIGRITPVSEDGQAAVAAVPLNAELSGFALNDTVKALRTAPPRAARGPRSRSPAGPRSARTSRTRSPGANITLLAVTAAVVALLLIVTYRSPVLWLVPLMVIGVRRPGRRRRGLRPSPTLTGLTADGSTTGITSVLVFGAGTNYALLLISRYREELGRNDQSPGRAEHRRPARRTRDRRQQRHRGAGAADTALASSPSTRSLGVQAASGLVVAAVFVLWCCRRCSALFGTRLFWPFIPRSAPRRPHRERGLAPGCDCGRDARRAGGGRGRRRCWRCCARTARHPDRAVANRAVPRQGRIGRRLRNTGRALPQRTTDPPASSAATDHAAEIARDQVHARRRVGRDRPGTRQRATQWSVVLDAAPASDEAFETVDALRDSVRAGRSAARWSADPTPRPWTPATPPTRDRLVVDPRDPGRRARRCCTYCCAPRWRR